MIGINPLNVALEKNGFDIETGRTSEERESFIQFFKENIYVPIARASSATLATVGMVSTAIVLSSILPSSMTSRSDFNGVLLAIPMMLISVKAILATGISKIPTMKSEDFTPKNIINTIVGTALSYLAFMPNLPVAHHVESICIASLGAIGYGVLTGTKVKMIASVIFGFSSSLALNVFASLDYNTPKLSFVTALFTFISAKYVMGRVEEKIVKKLD